jgi:16S rRNA (cytosine967-C5)-methyltransferase
MAELMGNVGHIIACDMHPHRLELIRAAMERTGVSIADVMKCDASVYAEDFAGRFDTVLADVPCSGLGVIGSKPEIKLTTDPETYPGLTDIQKNILNNAFEYLKPGGRLMYSTCTLNKNENEDVIKHLLSKKSSSARIIEMNTFLPYNGKVGFFYSIIEKTAN